MGPKRETPPTKGRKGKEGTIEILFEMQDIQCG